MTVRLRTGKKSKNWNGSDNAWNIYFFGLKYLSDKDRATSTANSLSWAQPDLQGQNVQKENNSHVSTTHANRRYFCPQLIWIASFVLFCYVLIILFFVFTFARHFCWLLEIKFTRKLNTFLTQEWLDMRFRWRRLLLGLVLVFISLQLWALIQLDPNSLNENDRSKRANEPRSTQKPAQAQVPDRADVKAPENLFKVDENLCEVTHTDAKSAIQRASDDCKPKIHKCKAPV